MNSLTDWCQTLFASLFSFPPPPPHKNARYLAPIGLYNGENNNNNTVTVKYKENSKYIAAKFNAR